VRHRPVAQPDAEPDRRDACRRHRPDVAPLAVRIGGEAQARGEQQLSAAQPGRRVGQLDAVRPRHGPVLAVRSREHREPERGLRDQPAHGHARPGVRHRTVRHAHRGRAGYGPPGAVVGIASPYAPVLRSWGRETTR
jgi:hypothetical protein